MRHEPISFKPAETREEALQRAARAWGIQTEYHDIWGKLHRASDDTLAKILGAFDVDSSSRDTLNQALEERLWNEWAVVLEPTVVESVTDGYVPIQILEGWNEATIMVEFHWENGQTKLYSWPAASLDDVEVANLRGEMFRRKKLPLPSTPPIGYHRLRIAIGSSQGMLAQAEARLILAPPNAHLPGNLRAAGVAISLYGLRSSNNWGCGDYADLRAFIGWAVRELDVSFIGLNPLHAIPNRQPYNTSPYLPTCSFYRNPIYLDVPSVEDVANSSWAQQLLKSPKVQSTISALRDAPHVEYEKVWQLKLTFLRLAFRRFLREYRDKSERAAEFRRFIEEEGEPLDSYAVYCAIDEDVHRRCPNIWIWPDWPEQLKDPASPAVAAFPRTHWRQVLFWKYVQWQSDVQLKAAQEHAIASGMTIGLYHDLALATDRCGGDLWAHRRFFVNGARVGSPPDGFSPKGQDWAFPPPHSEQHHADGYRLFTDSIRKNLRHGGALRIDHVMRFFRLFWIPDGKEAIDGAYVRDRWQDLLRILALESVRNQVLIVGEDLGTVEPEVREALHEYHVLSYRLLYFEKRDDNEFRRPEEYPRQALVSASTHDLPTLAGFWEQRDIEARRQAGLLPGDGSYQAQLRSRAEEKQKLLDLFFERDLLPNQVPRRADQIPEFTGDLHNAAIGFLASTPSMLFVLNQEDLFKHKDQQNLPGSTEQYPNWRNKMPFTLEELGSEQFPRDCAAMFRHWIRKTGRTNSGV